MLRDHSQHTGRKLADIAAAVTESHRLLVPELPQAAHARKPASGNTAAEP